MANFSPSNYRRFDDDDYVLNLAGIEHEPADLVSLFNTIGGQSGDDCSELSRRPCKRPLNDDISSLNVTANKPVDQSRFNTIGLHSNGDYSQIGMSGLSSTAPCNVPASHGSLVFPYPHDSGASSSMTCYPNDSYVTQRQTCNSLQANINYASSDRLMSASSLITPSLANHGVTQDIVPFNMHEAVGTHFDRVNIDDTFGFANGGIDKQRLIDTFDRLFSGSVLYRSHLQDNLEAPLMNPNPIAENCEGINLCPNGVDVADHNSDIGPYFKAESSKMANKSDKKQLLCMENEKSTNAPPKNMSEKAKVKMENEKSTNAPPKNMSKKAKVKTDDENSTNAPSKNRRKKAKVKTDDEKSTSVLPKNTRKKAEVKIDDEKSTSTPLENMGEKEKSKTSDEKAGCQIPSQEVLHKNSESSLPDYGLAVPLLKHQRMALEWMSKKETKAQNCSGGILADDQGLGKTVSTIALMLKERSPPFSSLIEKKEIETLNLDEDEHTNHSVKTKRILSAGTLVVCPTSVLRQWNEELDNKVVKEANLSVLMYYGANRTKDPFELAKYDVVITTYAIVSMEVPKQPLGEDGDETKIKTATSNKRKYTQSKSTDYPLANLRWFRVVLDEAQSIKNYKTQVARACWGLRAKRRWCLSGTPVQNSVDDFYSYFRFLKYYPFAVYKIFSTKIKTPIQRNQVAGYKSLRKILAKIMIRRTKASILNGEPIISLPPKTVTLKRIDFSAEERSFYRSLEDKTRAMFSEYAAAGTLKQNYVNILLMLLRMRQACDHPLLARGCSSSTDWRSSVEKAKQLPREELNRLLNCLEASLAICSICKDAPEDAIVTTCEHVFCNQCILDHISSDDIHCPFPECKKLLNKSSIFSKSALTVSVNDHGSEESENTNRCLSNQPVDSLEIEAAKVVYSAKMRAAIEVLQSIANPQDTTVREKAIVFSQWTGMLDMFERCLKDSSIGYRRLDGTMSIVAREKAVKDFNTLPEVTVIIMSLKAASLGLNMVAACHVILLDIWWNPTIEDQAIDRAHRIGQTRPVTVLRLTVKDTIEDRILALQEKKREMVASAFGENENENGGSKNRLTMEDMEYLFQS